MFIIVSCTMLILFSYHLVHTTAELQSDIYLNTLQSDTNKQEDCISWNSGRQDAHALSRGQTVHGKLWSMKHCWTE